MYQSEIEIYHRLTGNPVDHDLHPICERCGESLSRTVGKFKNVNTGETVYGQQAYFCHTCEYVTDPKPIKRATHD